MLILILSLNQFFRMTITFDMNSTVLSNPVVSSSMSKDVLETSAKLVDNFIQQDNSCYEMIDCLKMGGCKLKMILCII